MVVVGPWQFWFELQVLSLIVPPPAPSFIMACAYKLKKSIREIFEDEVPKVTEWLGRDSVKSQEDFGLLATAEKEVSSQIMPAAIAAGLKTDNILTQVRFKQLWAVCGKACSGAGQAFGRVHGGVRR